MANLVFQERLRRKRKELGLSLGDIARMIGVSEASVHRYERGGIKTPRNEIVLKLAEILQTTPIYLMGWEDMVHLHQSEDVQLVVNRLVDKKLNKKEIQELIAFIDGMKG